LFSDLKPEPEPFFRKFRQGALSFLDRKKESKKPKKWKKIKRKEKKTDMPRLSAAVFASVTAPAPFGLVRWWLCGLPFGISV
jgi:hypothetical protein